MKRIFAITVLLGLLAFAGSALALPYSFGVVGNVDKTLTAQVSVDFNLTGANTGVASFTLLNTTATQGTITGFALNLPNDGAGIASVTDITGNSNWSLLGSLSSPNSINAPQLSWNFDLGMGTGSNLSGGKPNKGIAEGESLTFNLLVSGSGLSAGSILAGLTGGDLTKDFVVRFQNTTGGGSDVATATPVPPAVWLLGSGLLGLMGLRRRHLA